jgi:GGDEF domain-containing protein
MAKAAAKGRQQPSRAQREPRADAVHVVGRRRLREHIQEAVQGLLDVRFGLVQCPDDGETEEALLHEAYQALAFAEMVNLPIVSRRALIADGI